MKTDLEIPDIFTAEDFDCLIRAEYRVANQKIDTTTREQLMAKRANERFKEIASSWQQTFGHEDQKHWSPSGWVSAADGSQTHTALIAFPQEIKKAECEHEPVLGFVKVESGFYGEWTCAKCGAKLKAKWEIIE